MGNDNSNPGSGSVKHCPRCNRDYPEALASCPHHAPAATIAFQRQKQAQPLSEMDTIGLQKPTASIDFESLAKSEYIPGSISDQMIGSLIADHYRIIALIGSGGMSAVYKARHELLDKVVAIKVLRAHLISQPASLKRFHQEAKAASHLTHPNIIAVHDFGISPQGQPYLIMDYLEGKSLGEILTEQTLLDPERAINIFIQICDGLGHAHQKGILHRDIKPSNIMLIENGQQELQVKIVDFGIAKLLPHAEIEGQRLTQTGEVFGSPVYMSPEQCMGQTLDMRSDLFSMGCVMYETLCGKEAFLGQNMLETMYMRLTERPAPFDQALHIPKSVEHITFITLASKPDERYQSMAELKNDLKFAADSHDSKSAFRLPSLKKLPKKTSLLKSNKGPSTELIWALAAMIIVVSGGFIYMNLKGSHEHDPQNTVSALWRQFDQDGQKQIDQGNFPQAEKSLALAVHEAEKFGEQDKRLSKSLTKLSVAYRAQGKNSEADSIDSRLEKLKQSHPMMDESDSNSNLDELADLTLSLVPKNIEKGKWAQYDKLIEKLNHLAMLCIDQQNYDQAEKMLLQASKIEDATLGPDDANRTRTLSNLALLYGTRQGKYDQAEPLYKRVVDIKIKALGPADPEVAGSYYDLGTIYEAQGKYADAESLYKKALAIYQATFGSDEPKVAMTLTGLANLYRLQSKYGQAEPLYEQALAIYQKTNGHDHSTVGMSYNNLAGLYFNQGKYSQSEPMYRQALAIYEKNEGPDHPNVATIINNLAVVLYKEGKYDEAEPLFKRALSIRERVLSPEHPAIAQSQNALAELYRAQGRWVEAEPLYKDALAVTEKACGPDHPEDAIILNSLGQLYTAEAKYRQAEEYYKRALEIRIRALGPDHPEVASSVNELANLYSKENRFQDAEPLYKQALAIRQKALGPQHPEVASTLDDYANLLFHTNRVNAAINLKLKSLYIWFQSHLPNG